MNRAASLVAVTPPRHIGQIFFQRVAELGNRPFVRFQKGGEFESLSWSEFGAMTQALALALRAHGLAPGDTVAIIGNNSVRWLSADLATLASGLANVIVSPLFSDTLLRKILDHAGCRAAFVEDESAVARLLRLREQLPALEQIFVMSEGADGQSEAVPFSRLIELGCKQDQRGLKEILEGVHADDLATIMYTSGSTGEPKGVMRTQNNLLANISNGGEIVTSAPDELLVVVLSLNHLYGRFGFLKSAVTGRSIALVDATELDVDLDVLRELAGTAMSLVPRVMDRLWGALLERDDNRNVWVELEALDDRKQNVGLEPSDQRRFEALRLRLTQSARRLLGGRMKYISYGGAAMPPRIMKFFHVTAIPLLGSYGSTECGGVTLSSIGERRPGNLGKPFANVEVRIAADGEILVRGPTVTPGYFKDPQATATAFDRDGWFYTGDLGMLETDGSLKIVGRKKDVFYCTDGSNIYPGFIESRLESEPFIRQAILLGDHRPFVAALIVPDRERIASSAGCESGSLSAAAITAALWTAIERVNLGLEACERIRQIAIFDSDFPMAARTVNIFQKLKVDRSWVASHYEREIGAIYAAQGEGDKL